MTSKVIVTNVSVSESKKHILFHTAVGYFALKTPGFVTDAQVRSARLAIGQAINPEEHGMIHMIVI